MTLRVPQRKRRRWYRSFFQDEQKSRGIGIKSWLKSPSMRREEVRSKKRMKRKNQKDVECRVKELRVRTLGMGWQASDRGKSKGIEVGKRSSVPTGKKRKPRGKGTVEVSSSVLTGNKVERSEEVMERGLVMVKRAVVGEEKRDGSAQERSKQEGERERKKVGEVRGKRKRRYGERSKNGEAMEAMVVPYGNYGKDMREQAREATPNTKRESRESRDTGEERRGEKERQERRLVEGRKEYSPVRRIPSKAGRTNDFGLQYNRWYEVRKSGGWVGKYVKVAGSGEKAWKTEKGRLEEYEKKRRREEVERARKRNTVGITKGVVASKGVVAWKEARKERELLSERKKEKEESEVRDMGPRRRSGVRIWGKERRENGRPGEKRVRRSRSETRSVRGSEVREKGKGRKEGEERWNRVKRRGEDVEKYSQSYVRETREARKRYVERRGKKEKSRIRKNQKGRHERRMGREDPERVGGKELMEKVREKCGVRRTGRGEGEGVKSEGTGRKARREVQKREELGERRNWGRKGIGRDGRGVGVRGQLQRRGVWRTKEKRAAERYRYKEGEGKKARRRDEVVSRERREKKGYRKRGEEEREGYEKRKGREAKYMRRQGEE